MIFSHVLYQLSYLGLTNNVNDLAENSDFIEVIRVRTVSANRMEDWAIGASASGI